MTRDQALIKIKKCLRLSRSSNEHEAASALRHAQALMRDHCLTGDDVKLADVHEATAKARSAAMNMWELKLASAVCEAMGVDSFNLVVDRLLPSSTGFSRYKRERDVVFVGLDAAPDVAAYAYDVLARQCAKARMAHIARQPKACKPITKTARGDEFALAWVFAVRGLIERFAGRAGDQALIAQYMAVKHPNLRQVTPRNTTVGRNVGDSFSAGHRAGNGARLDHALGGAEAQRLLDR